MSSICNITSNPDISGIGVRTAIYAQAALTLIQPALASADGHISADELLGLHQLYLGILLPGCALLLAAIIQARTFGLTVYHATIVLNLSWINNTSALIFFEFALIAQLRLDEERDYRRTAGGMLGTLYEVLEELLYKNWSQQSPEAQAWTLAMDGANRTREQIQRAAKQEGLKSSKEILENITQGLDLLQLRERSWVLSKEQSTTMTKEQKDDAKTSLVDLIKRDRTRLPKSLGLFVDEDLEDGYQAGRHPNLKKAITWASDATKAVTKTMANIFNPVVKVVMWIPGGLKAVRLLQRDWTMSLLASGHLTLFSAFGVWLWFTIDTFENDPNCGPFTKYSIIVHTIPVASPAFRRISKVIYIIFSIPVINIIFFVGLEIGAIYLFHLFTMIFPFFRKAVKRGSLTGLFQSRSPRILYYFIGLTLLVQVYLIASTELTIKSNGHLLNQDVEEDWTFGQTLAVALTVIPFILCAQEIEKNTSRWWLKKDPNDA